MKQKLFTIAAVISFLACLFYAWASLSCYAFYRHGFIATVNGNATVMHAIADLRDAEIYLLPAICFAVLPGYWLFRRMRRRRDGHGFEVLRKTVHSEDDRER